VEKAIKAIGIECSAFRYGATDSKAKQFDADTADLQTFIGTLPSAEAASATSTSDNEPKKLTR
jgi:hypothetical protein